MVNSQRMLEAEILPDEWFNLYSDLYRENHDERASDGEILADAMERLKVITTPDRFDASTLTDDRSSF